MRAVKLSGQNVVCMFKTQTSQLSINRCFHPEITRSFCGRQLKGTSLTRHSLNGSIQRSWSMCSIQMLRHNSTNAPSQDTVTLDLSEKLSADNTASFINHDLGVPDISETINALGEPTLASLGLASNFPPGLLQQGLEYLHVTVGLPWWQAVIAGTLLIRTFMLPISIASNRDITLLNNHAPNLKQHTEAINKARLEGDEEKMKWNVYQYEQYFKTHKLKNTLLMKPIVYPFLQIPVFLSVFMGLKAMAYLPVESLKTGGLLWITDLTLPDPFLILPVLTASTLYVTLMVGADGARPDPNNAMMMKVFKFMPIMMFPVIANFPAVMCLYWCTANFFSLSVVCMLKIPAVRKFFNIEERIVHPPPEGGPQEGFIESFKKTYRSQIKEQEMRERAKFTQVRFMTEAERQERAREQKLAEEERRKQTLAEEERRKQIEAQNLAEKEEKQIKQARKG